MAAAAITKKNYPGLISIFIGGVTTPKFGYARQDLAWSNQGSECQISTPCA
jgi:hypothetical protein